jgi:hypothetical protein
MEVDLEVNPEKSKYMLMSYYKSAGQKHGRKIANKSFEGVEKFIYLGTTLTDQNSMNEEIKSRLNSGNGSYRLGQSLLSSHLLFRNVKVKTYKTIILLFVLYGCETWSLILREEHRLKVCENRVLRIIFGPNRDEITEEWRKLPNEELRILYSSPNIIRQIKSRRMWWVGHVARMGEEVVQGLVGKPEGKRPLGRPRHRWEEMGSECILGRLAGG